MLEHTGGHTVNQALGLFLRGTGCTGQHPAYVHMGGPRGIEVESEFHLIGEDLRPRLTGNQFFIVIVILLIDGITQGVLTRELAGLAEESADLLCLPMELDEIGKIALGVHQLAFTGQGA